MAPDDIATVQALRSDLALQISRHFQTGVAPAEAGVYVSRGNAPSAPGSRLARDAHDALIEAARKLTPEQRLDAMLEQCQLFGELNRAGQKAGLAAASRPKGRR